MYQYPLSQWRCDYRAKYQLHVFPTLQPSFVQSYPISQLAMYGLGHFLMVNIVISGDSWTDRPWTGSEDNRAQAIWTWTVFLLYHYYVFYTHSEFFILKDTCPFVTMHLAMSGPHMGYIWTTHGFCDEWPHTSLRVKGVLVTEACLNWGTPLTLISQIKLIASWAS